MAVITAEIVEQLTDDQAPAFLEALERIGTIAGAARALAVERRSAYERRYRDRAFRDAWDSIRSAPGFPARRLHNASDQLFAAIDAFPTSDEYTVDELINCVFDPTQEPPQRRGVDPVRLGAARERMRTAGTCWAKAVVYGEHDRKDLELALVAS